MLEETSPSSLAAMPSEETWFAGIESEHNRKGYVRDVAGFMRHAGIEEPTQLRDTTPETGGRVARGVAWSFAEAGDRAPQAVGLVFPVR